MAHKGRNKMTLPALRVRINCPVGQYNRCAGGRSFKSVSQLVCPRAWAALFAGKGTKNNKRDKKQNRTGSME